MKRLAIGAVAFVALPTALYLTANSSTENVRAAAASASANPLPLFDSTTKLEPPTIVDTPTALITRVGDRGRDRHAREWMFHAYEHYLPLYWQNRTVSIEVIDTVAKGGSTVTFNMVSMAPLNLKDLRAFYESKYSIAQYSDNEQAKETSPLHYTATVRMNTNERRPLRVGDLMEIEFSGFIAQPFEGRTNYYGTAFLYQVGKGGMQPWHWLETDLEAAHKNWTREPDDALHANRPVSIVPLGAFPLPELALSGGMTTGHENYSEEPKSRFQQMAMNIAPTNAEPFLLGRRLHHTDFETGKHSEPENPVFKEQVGKLGTQFVNHSCIACHVGNGRGLPAAPGGPMTDYAVHVGIDAMGTPHPNLGATLQSQASTGAPEGSVTIASWTTTNGTYADGSAYTLQQPVYKFSGPTIPQFYSIRLAPPLVGMGLLEAVEEKDIVALAAARKSAGVTGHIQLVTDPEGKDLRLGRFGVKAGEPRLKDQVASALQNDMGITTSIYPMPDRGSAQPALATKSINDKDLDDMYRYVALLAVPPRRNFADPEVVHGEQLFASANCVDCHAATLKTGSYHPLAELRNQTIHPYTDLLLHDMGKGLADNMAQDKASGADWRTPPLWGLGLTAGVSGGEAYLHDGRARTLNEAILWHGGEGEASKENFRKMSAADRAALIKFLQSL